MNSRWPFFYDEITTAEAARRQTRRSFGLGAGFAIPGSVFLAWVHWHAWKAPLVLAFAAAVFAMFGCGHLLLGIELLLLGAPSGGTGDAFARVLMGYGRKIAFVLALVAIVSVVLETWR